jgi:hypothetical protein
LVNAFAQDDIYYTPPSQPQQPVEQPKTQQPSPQAKSPMPDRDFKFYFGPRVGFQYNSISIDPAPRATFKNYVGISMGAASVLEFGQNLTLHSDLLLTSKKGGLAFKLNNYSDSTVTEKYVLYYLSVPLMMSYTLIGQDDQSKLKLYIVAGGEINALLDANSKIKYSWDTEDITYVIGSKSKVAKTEVAITYGLGIRARLNDRTSFVAESRFVRGSTDINKGLISYGNAFALPRIYSNGINTNFSLLFRLY